MDIDALVAAGLYDPDAPEADDRLGLLRYLARSGATLEEMVEAARSGNPPPLAPAPRLVRGPLAAVDLAERSGAGVEEVFETYRLLGIDVPDPEALIFDEREVRLLELLVGAAGSLPPGIAQEILRSIGTA